MAGEHRTFNGFYLTATADHVSSDSLFDDVVKWNTPEAQRNTMALTYPDAIATNAGTVIGYDGAIANSSETFTVTGSLPTTDLSTLKWLGYRYCLNGHDITNKVSSDGVAPPFSFKLSDVWIAQDDVIYIR